jgi:hypothetical protein
LAPGQTQQNRFSVQTKDPTKQGSASPSADRRSQIADRRSSNQAIKQSSNQAIKQSSNQAIKQS